MENQELKKQEAAQEVERNAQAERAAQKLGFNSVVHVAYWLQEKDKPENKEEPLQ